MTKGARATLRWIPASLVIASTITVILVAVFWSRSYRRCDQVMYDYCWIGSWKGAVYWEQGDTRIPMPLGWVSNQAQKDDFRGSGTKISFGWLLFMASLPADIIGLIWMFRWARERDAATGGHLTARVVLYLAVAIPVLLFIAMLLSR